jgi:hypothetical protein
MCLALAVNLVSDCSASSGCRLKAARLRPRRCCAAGHHRRHNRWCMLFCSDAMTSTTFKVAFGNASSSVQGQHHQRLGSHWYVAGPPKGRHAVKKKRGAKQTLRAGLNNKISRLTHAEDVTFNSFAKQHEPICLPDTRVALLNEIHSWADGQDERCVF